MLALSSLLDHVPIIAELRGVPRILHDKHQTKQSFGSKLRTPSFKEGHNSQTKPHRVFDLENSSDSVGVLNQKRIS